MGEYVVAGLFYPKRPTSIADRAFSHAYATMLPERDSRRADGDDAGTDVTRMCR